MASDTLDHGNVAMVRHSLQVRKIKCFQPLPGSVAPNTVEQGIDAILTGDAFSRIGICDDRRGIMTETPSGTGCRVKRENRMVTEELGGARELPAGQPGLHPALPAPAQRALTFGLLLSALRCTMQYIVLPFVLPWIGVAASIPPWLTLALGTLALVFLVRNVRRLWKVRHARRWSYLLVAGVVAASLLLFVFVDVRTLLHL